MMYFARIEADFAASGADHMEVKMLIPAGLFITPTCLFLSIVQPKTRILKAFL